LVDVGAKLDLFDNDARFFLARFFGLLVGLEAVFTPVHHAHHDRARVGSHLDEIEASLYGNLFGLV
jgi:hypothetical protein